MYNGVKAAGPAFFAFSGFRYGWLILAAATLFFLGKSLTHLVRRPNGLSP
jgi:hypothetical protein